jgi:translation initiation factor IF-2
LKANVQVEGLGGDTPVVPISAKTGKGVPDLLDTILFIASMKELQYKRDNPVKAYIIESKKEKAGIMATVIIKDGRLSVGDTVYAGMEEAKIKAIFSDSGKNLTEVFPSTPFLLLGFKELPAVGSELSNLPIEAIKQDVVAVIDERTKDEKNKALFVTDTSNKKLKLIVKTDSQGSLEAISSSLAKNENVEVVLAGLGEISKSDIFLAKVSKAIVIGFSIVPDKNMLQLAKEEKVIIKTYNIIYELLEELTEVSDLLNEKQEKEKSLKGEAKILATFVIEQEQIAGVRVTKGKVGVDDRIELFRNDRLVAESKIVSLRERAKSVREVKKNDEGGVLFYPKLDFVVGDVIKSYSI